MKIAQLVHNLYSVNPESTRAIYSNVGTLTNGLVDRGNDVTLFASGDSITKAKLESVNLVALNASHLPENHLRTYYHLLASKCYQMADKFDIIHSHFSTISSFYSPLTKTPTVQSLHNALTEEAADLLRRFKDGNYIAFSNAQKIQLPELNWVGTIYHGVDTNRFAFNAVPEDYLFCIGRITEDKGVHLAIEAALEADVPLVIAGPSYPEEKYWQTHIQKYIDGQKVKYIGTADLATKIKYYQNARGLLFPTQLPETFGMVMIEAMSCGTPVIGWDNGSVPEIVQHGDTGYVVKNVKEMVKAIRNIHKIKREAVRQRAQLLFSIEKMVAGYEKVFLKIIEQNRTKLNRK